MLIKAVLFWRKKCHVTQGGGGGGQRNVTKCHQGGGGGGLKSVKKVSRIIWMAPKETLICLKLVKVTLGWTGFVLVGLG